MSLLAKIGFGGSAGYPASTAELPDIFPFPMECTPFVETDVTNIFYRILVDVIERTEGIPDEKLPLLWDNCLASEVNEGLITMVAIAIAKQGELFLVYDKALKLVRKATAEEQNKIRDDYKARAESSTGVYISFKKYDRVQFIRLYSTLEYHNIGSLFKSMNLSKAIQIKAMGLRGTVGAADSSIAAAQGKAIAENLKRGRDVLIDKDDSIETTTPDLTATDKGLDFIAQKQSFYLGLPASYIRGAANSTGLSDTGHADARAVERGLRPYYFSIIKPLLKELLSIDTKFKSEDSFALDLANKTLTTFEATSDSFLSAENKTKLLNRLYGLPEKEKGDEPRKVDQPTDPKALPAGKGPTPPPDEAK